MDEGRGGRAQANGGHRAEFLGGASAQATEQSRGEAKRRRIDNQLEAIEAFTFPSPMVSKR